jgi:hypothetical protein
MKRVKVKVKIKTFQPTHVGNDPQMPRRTKGRITGKWERK